MSRKDIVIYVPICHTSYEIYLVGMVVIILSCIVLVLIWIIIYIFEILFVTAIF